MLAGLNDVSALENESFRTPNPRRRMCGPVTTVERFYAAPISSASVYEERVAPATRRPQVLVAADRLLVLHEHRAADHVERGDHVDVDSRELTT
jgi:hypothetical protein